MVLTMALPLRSWIQRFDSEGSIRAQACGMITRNIPRTGLRLRALTASY